MEAVPAAVPAQLPFPFAPASPASPVLVSSLGRPVPPSWRARLALGGRAVVLSCSGSRDRARVALEAQHDAPGAWSIALDLHLRPILAATIQSDSPDRLHWALSARAPGREGREFFAYALRWATRKLAGETSCRARIAAVEAGLRPVLRRAAADLLHAVHPAARAAACRFAPPTRARVAAALARDPRGWLGQVARAHPGLVLLGLALVEAEETGDAGLALLHDLGEGRRLGPALDGALAAWSAALPAWAAQVDLWPRPLRAAWAAAAELGADARAAMLGAQRILVRRTGPWCEPALLLVPPPLRFAPEDVPAAARANADWFRVMRVPGVTVDALPRAVERPLAEAFAAFASRHAGALVRAPKGIPLELWLAELRELLRLSGRTPSRVTDPARLVARVDVRELGRRPPPAPPRPRWPLARREAAVEPAPDRPARRTLAPVAAEPEAGGRVATAPGQAWGSVTISPLRFAPWRSERASLTQLTTFRELREEGARMRHCVADHRAQIERGDLLVLSARVDGNPLTVALAPWGSGWRVWEWKGFANRRVTATERDALRPWLQENGVMHSQRT